MKSKSVKIQLLGITIILISIFVNQIGLDINNCPAQEFSLFACVIGGLISLIGFFINDNNDDNDDNDDNYEDDENDSNTSTPQA